MKVHTVSRVNPAQQIAEQGALPIQKQQPRTEGLDATMQATALCAEIFALARQDDTSWRTIAVRIINGTTDFRAALVKQLNSQLKELRASNAQALDPSIDADGKPEPGKDARKIAGANVNAASVNISRCRGIANAFNGGASVNGLIEFHVAQGRAKSDGITLEHVSYTSMHKYAALFGESKAGRKADPWITKFGKWLEGAGKLADDADEAAQAQYAAAVALYNKLNKG